MHRIRCWIRKPSTRSTTLTRTRGGGRRTNRNGRALVRPEPQTMDEGDVSKKQDDEQQADVVSVDALMAPAENGGEDGTPETMETSGLVAIVEALVFASPEPITQKQLFKLLDTEPKEEVQAALQELARRYERSGGLQLVEVAGGYQIVTRPELHEWVRRLFHERTTQRLSVQALETLAVIAYKQPVTAPEITEIRGVNTAGVVNTLIERQLVKIVGRKPVVGRPFMYATTREFLIRFGLRDLSDLPRLRKWPKRSV